MEFLLFKWTVIVVTTGVALTALIGYGLFHHGPPLGQYFPNLKLAWFP